MRQPIPFHHSKRARRMHESIIALPAYFTSGHDSMLLPGRNFPSAPPPRTTTSRLQASTHTRLTNSARRLLRRRFRRHHDKRATGVRAQRAAEGRLKSLIAPRPQRDALGYALMPNGFLRPAPATCPSMPPSRRQPARTAFYADRLPPAPPQGQTRTMQQRSRHAQPRNGATPQTSTT